MRINPFLLAFVCAAFVSCGQPEALSFVDICTLGRPYPNDADCSDGILFQFHSQNEVPEGDFHGVSLACLETGGPLGFIDLGFNQNYHNSSITFSSRRFAPEDRFPLLYASENYAPNHFYKVVVYRVVEQAGNLSLTQVQTLVMPDPEKALAVVLVPVIFVPVYQTAPWPTSPVAPLMLETYTHFATSAAPATVQR